MLRKRHWHSFVVSSLLCQGACDGSIAAPLVNADEEFPLGISMTMTVETGSGSKLFTLGADEPVRASTIKFCNWHHLGMMGGHVGDVFSSGASDAAPCVDVIIRDMKDGAREKKHWINRLSGKGTWPLAIPNGSERYLFSMDDQANMGLIIAAWLDLGYSEIDKKSFDIPQLASDSDFDVLWSLFPQQGRSAGLSNFLGIPVDWSYYRNNLPSWDLSQMRPTQTHNHCLLFHGAPIGPKHNLAKGIQSLNENLEKAGYEGWEGNKECIANLCYPRSYVVMKDSGGLDDSAKVQEELVAGNKLLAKASHSSGGGSITVLRTRADLVNLLNRATTKSQFLVQRLVKADTALIEGRRFHFRLYIGLTSVHPLRIYIHHNNETGGYATLAKKTATSENPTDPTNHEEDQTCRQDSGVCTLERDRQFVTNYGARQIPQREFMEIYRNLTGADPDELLRRMHHSVVAMILSASHYSRHPTDFRERLQSLLGGGKCFEILGIDFLFEENVTHDQGRAGKGSSRQRPWIPYLIDVTPSCGYGRPTPEASHDMLRDFFRAFVSRDPIAGSEQPREGMTFEQLMTDFSRNAAARGFWINGEDEAHLRELYAEEQNSGEFWLRIFPPIQHSLVGTPDFDYTPLFAGGPSRADALAMLWAGSTLSNSPINTKLELGPVDEAMACFYKNVGEYRISASDEYLLTQILRSTFSSSDKISAPTGVVQNVPPWLALFVNTNCIDPSENVRMFKYFVR